MFARLKHGSLVVACLLPVACGPGEPTTVSVDVAERYQTMRGMEVTAQAGQFEARRFDEFRDEVFAQTLELGVDRVRLEVARNTENSVDYFTQLRTGKIDFDDWKKGWYLAENDDADPHHIRPEGFQFALLDGTVETVVEPLRKGLAERGKALYVNLCYVDFGKQPGFSHREDPEEYAELMEATFVHLQERWGWVPDAVELMLEPDQTRWTGEDLGRVLVATDRRLEKHGFRPDFVAPSTMNAAKALPFLDGMAKTPGAVERLTELSYHRYGDETAETLTAIARRARAEGLAPGMLEHIWSGVDDLYEDLTLVGAASWQQYALAYPTEDNGAQLLVVDESEGEPVRVAPGHLTRALRHVFRLAQRGTVRVGSRSDQPDVRALAFVSPDGACGVAVLADRSVPLTVSGLPGGTYAVRCTTSRKDDVLLEEITLEAGASLVTLLPAAGTLSVEPLR